MNKFIFEKYLSNTPIFFQRLIFNQYVFIKNKKHDLIKYKDSINSFKKNKCIFIHIPKTAGISVTKSLFGEFQDTNHLSLRRYRLIFGNADFNSYYKFTFVRNPWEKVFSCYRFLKKGGTKSYHKKWKEEVLDEYNDFNIFVKKWINFQNIYSFSHFIPQHWFITLNSEKLKVDFIGKFENLDKDFKKISSKLNLNQNLLHLNKSDSNKRIYTNFYNQESIDIIGRIYKEDIDLFKYDYINN